jgi:phage/conjugal plasmid C-4 type zinc finger TraR family protein
MDMADMADKFIEDQVLTSVMRIREHDVAQAGRKASAKRYCEVCGGVIPRARLKAVPGCSCCVNCASKRERERAGLFTAGDRQRINAELDDYLLSIC